MKKAAWKKRIIEACTQAGTYRPCFDGAVDALADILARRDAARSAFEDSGGSPVVTHTNKAGAANIEKNPALVLVDELDRTALTYWRDLGLTPKGLKAIDEGAMKTKGAEGLEMLSKALNSIEG